jgi:anti-sigma B factor antagonist
MPTFESMERATDDRVTILVDGEVDLDSAPQLVALGRSHLDDSAVKTLVLDLSGVTFMDSTTVGALVALRNQANGLHKTLQIAGTSGSAHRLLKLTGLDQVFEFTDETTARLAAQLDEL